ncbi:MAG: DUF4390 domain-containing protein [Desulfobacterales bacterium]|nr:DUF4390 domain-containing protein [Desulfobacterales bacterium]
MKPFLKRTTIFLLVFLVLVVQQPVFAQDDARLANIIVTNTRDDLLVYMNVEGAFTDEMIEAINSGVPTTFSFYVQLYYTRSLWADKQIADIVITHTIAFNALKKEYAVTRSWDRNNPVTTQSLDEAKQLMAKINSLKVIPLNKLEKGIQYQLRAKAELNKVTLPFYLHYVLFFLSLWDFETDWYTIDFIY